MRLARCRHLRCCRRRASRARREQARGGDCAHIDCPYSTCRAILVTATLADKAWPASCRPATTERCIPEYISCVYRWRGEGARAIKQHRAPCRAAGCKAENPRGMRDVMTNLPSVVGDMLCRVARMVQFPILRVVGTGAE